MSRIYDAYEKILKRFSSRNSSRYLDDDPVRADEFRYIKAKDISDGPHLAAPGKTPNLLPTPGFIEGRPHCARELDLCAHNHDYPL